MVRIVGSFVALVALWLLLSGLYKPLIIFFGVISAMVAIWVVERMDRADGDRLGVTLRPVAMIVYVFWLMVEIAKANLAVTRVILSPRMPIRQHLFRIPNTQHSDLGRVMFANSITLTPGTISVETEENRFLVHALAYSDADPDALADMDRRVSAVETRRAG